jgi:hypothetical protein
MPLLSVGPSPLYPPTKIIVDEALLADQMFKETIRIYE